MSKLKLILCPVNCPQQSPDVFALWLMAINNEQLASLQPKEHRGIQACGETQVLQLAL